MTRPRSTPTTMKAAIGHQRRRIERASIGPRGSLSRRRIEGTTVLRASSQMQISNAAIRAYNTTTTPVQNAISSETISRRLRHAGVRSQSGVRQVGWPLERGRARQVERVEQVVGFGVTPCQRRQVPLRLDELEYRGVVVNDV